MDFKFLQKYIYMIAIVGTTGILYRKYNDYQNTHTSKENYQLIRKYLLNDTSLVKNNKPIIWIHLPYEFNARDWESFGSRGSHDLNAPYLYLTIKSIIQKCSNSFHICLIDDDSFGKLLSDWNIDLGKVNDPLLSNVRTLGIMKTLYEFGGLYLPPSFLCKKNLKTLFEEGTKNDKVFVCEAVSRNITSELQTLYPSTNFIGCNKKNETILNLIRFIEVLISQDPTNYSKFNGSIEKEIFNNYASKSTRIISGTNIGTKTDEGDAIILDDLMSSGELELSCKCYGIYIPHKELSERTAYQWFLKLQMKDIFEANIAIANEITKVLSPK